MGRKKLVCRFCNVEVGVDETVCESAEQDRTCFMRKDNRPSLKFLVVGVGFEHVGRIEDDPARLKAMQQLIRSGCVWHPEIDKDGHLGRQANDLIRRGILTAPRGREAIRVRHLFEVSDGWKDLKAS